MCRCGCRGIRIKVRFLYKIIKEMLQAFRPLIVREQDTLLRLRDEDTFCGWQFPELVSGSERACLVDTLYLFDLVEVVIKRHYLPESIPDHYRDRNRIGNRKDSVEPEVNSHGQIHQLSVNSLH